MELDQESGIDLSSLADVDGEDADETSTEVDSEDEYETSTDEEDGDEYETFTDEEDEDGGGDGGPPMHFADDLASPPESILLDIDGNIDARKNATTAQACRSKGGAIQATFWVARPPRVSCFTVHCDGLKPDKFEIFPTVLAAEEDLVLLRVSIGLPRNPCSTSIEHYIYQAAGATPTLRLLADPPGYADRKVGILRLRDGEFLMAAIQDVAGTNGWQYDLHLFDSRTWAWTTRRMCVDNPESFTRMRPTKALTIGGERGSMAWVLSQSLLFCDLLAVDDDGAMLRNTPLPPEGSPCDVRDIAVVHGHIKVFEMGLKKKRRAITSTSTLVTKYMNAAAWEKTDPWESWRKDCVLDIFKVPVDRTYPELPPHLHDMGKLQCCQPALSLHEDDVVYIMAKAKGSRHKAWMLAVDVRKKTLREASAFDPAERAYKFTYLQSGMSNYLRIQSSTR